MIVHRIDREQKKYSSYEIDKIKYFNSLIKNYISQIYHSIKSETKISPRNVYCEELSFQFLSSVSYSHGTYMMTLEHNSLLKKKEVVIIFITDDLNFDVYEDDSRKIVNDHINKILESDIYISCDQISII
jgi:hypothetical protein